MSERFKLNDKGSFILEDGEPLKPLGNVVHKLNEQQATIKRLEEENEQLQKKYDNLYSAIEKTARDMAEKRIYEMEDFDVFQRITDYVEELDDD